MQARDQTNESQPALEQVTDATLRGFVGYRLKRAYGSLRADLLGQLEPIGLRITTYSTLVLICDNPGLRQSAAGSVLEIKRSNMVVIVDDLEQRGWISRKRVPSDRRAYAVFPTRSGKRVCAKATELVAEHDRQRLQCLSNEELNQLSRLLLKIETSAAR